MLALMELLAISLTQVVSSFKKNTVQIQCSIRWCTVHADQIFANCCEINTNSLSALAMTTTDVNHSDLLLGTCSKYRLGDFLPWRMIHTESAFSLRLCLVLGEAVLQDAKVKFKKHDQQFERLVSPVATAAKVH